MKQMRQMSYDHNRVIGIALLKAFSCANNNAIYVDQFFFVQSAYRTKSKEINSIFLF